MEFTLVFQHEVLQYHEGKIRATIAQCFGPLLDWIPQPKIKSGPGQKPNLRDPALKIFCRTDASGSYRMKLKTQRIPHLIYADRITEWLGTMDFYQPMNQRPWIEIQSDEAFPMSWAPFHATIPVWECHLGSMCWATEFVKEIDFGNGNRVVGDFYHDIKVFELVNDNRKLAFQYSSILRIFVQYASSKLHLFLQLLHPPSAFAQDSCENMFKRVDSFPAMPASILGRCNTIKLTMPMSDVTKEIVSRLYIKCGKNPVVYTSIHTPVTTAPLPKLPHVDLGHFGCTYMLTALLWRTRTLELQVPDMVQRHDRTTISDWANLFNLLKDYANSKPNSLYLALVDVVSLFDEGAFLDYKKAIFTLLEFYDHTEDMLNLKDQAYISPASTRSVWRATITPTRYLLWPAVLMFENRILRNFDSEYACRVLIRDENRCRLSTRRSETGPEFFQTAIKGPLLEGIQVGPRNFEFLSWSNSQIREHGLWTYSEDPKGTTAEHIRRWSGDYTQIRSVSKYMARMGQCFSQTQESVTVPLSKDNMCLEEDVVGGMDPESKKPYCFTDGVGRISRKLLEKVRVALNLEGEVCPSAVQFRYGGCKGMLVLDPELEGVDIVFRESQNKFACGLSQKLEICKVSGPVSVNLNRQLISILDYMGVETGVFLKMQEAMLEAVTDILLEQDKALEYLSGRCQLHNLSYKDISKAGVDINTEPFFRTMLLALHKKAVNGLRAKARLEVSPDLGRNMFGVVDETRTLKYGQVFVKYSTDVTQQVTTTDTRVLTGKVLVTKNPCVQPGDVRIFDAVDIPALHHIVDCIVFPQKGKRPHPNEMSGSDLDGDEYTVIWDQNLHFKRENFPASNFPCIPETKIDRKIDVSDMLDFLCMYIQNDPVGLVANAHLAQSDRLGLTHRICENIARKFNTAVDFIKNGKLVALVSCLDYYKEREERVQYYPDFMEKGKHKKSYKSKRALGKLYRICKGFQEAGENGGLSYTQVKVNPKMLYRGHEKYKGVAKKLRDRYNRRLSLLLSNNDLYHEAEATAKANVRLQEQRDRAEVEDMVTQSLKTLWIKIDKDFQEELSHITSGEERMENMLQLASACYFVTYADPNPIYLSFPWVQSKLLLAIVKKNSSEGAPPQDKHFNPFKRGLQDILERCIADNEVAPLTEEDIDNLKTDFPNMELSIPLERALRVILHWGDYDCLIKDENSEDDIFEEVQLVNKEKQIPRRQFTSSFLGLKGIKTAGPETPEIDLILRYLHTCVALRFQQSSKPDNDKVKPGDRTKPHDKTRPEGQTKSDNQSESDDRTLSAEQANSNDQAKPDDQAKSEDLPKSAVKRQPVVNMKPAKYLGRKAMYAYHNIAASGNLTALGLQIKGNASQYEELLEEPIILKEEIVREHSRDNFQRLKTSMLAKSGCKAVNIRKTGRDMLLSAAGTAQSIGKLKRALKLESPNF